MRKKVTVENWTLAIVPNRDVTSGFDAKTYEAVLNYNGTVIPAAVPGNFELDMMREGLLEDLYYGDNIRKAQELEDRHLWYAAEFTVEDIANTEPFLNFEGIDTVSEIYLDGVLLGKTENMLIPHTFSLAGASNGKHSIVVHIIPVALYSRKHPTPLGCKSLPYNLDSLTVRKAPSMYGWDIMPRIISGGLWKPVTVEYLPKNRIEEIYIYTRSLCGSSATLEASVRVGGETLIPGELTYTVEGICKDSRFFVSDTIFGSTRSTRISLTDAKLWMPKNYGLPNLYDVTVTLYHNGIVCDSRTLSFGIRTVQLERTSLAGDDGEFCFRINGQKIFCMGSNWVPPDAFPSRHNEYQQRGLEMLADLNCNIVRCWGGNVYPNESFYDFCDHNGILVWQDFSMACGVYPNDPEFLKKMETEARYIVCALRNHPSLLIWAGDNECDDSYWDLSVYQDDKAVIGFDPNDNLITRSLLPRVVRENDPARPFLPSSPYIDHLAVEDRRPSEEHLWGPRDFFKGEFYSTATAHFASETGYHGCPSPETLRRFIPDEHLLNWGDSKLCDDTVWLYHSSSMEPTSKAIYSYRIPLMTSQVERIFGKAADNLSDYALQSQISQAEAKKYFIERFRIGKWRRTGIIWWNLIDGWPQISDAVVDWYGCKKLAYHYIKTSQMPFTIMVDEPKDGVLTLCAANDTREKKTVRYSVTNLATGKTVLQGECTVIPDTTDRIATFYEEAGACYLIRWDGDACGKNHFTAAIGEGIDLKEYSEWMKEIGYWDIKEGF